jgi:hypothetical protein
MTSVIPQPGETLDELRERIRRVEELLGIYVDPGNNGSNQQTEPQTANPATPNDAIPGTPASHSGKDTPSK